MADLSVDARAIRRSVERRQIRSVYHFTPMSQVPGILQHGGIHPRLVLRQLGVNFSDDARRWSRVNDQRKSEELSAYVAVSVARPWGMMQNEPDCVVFAVNRDVLWRAGTAFIGRWSWHDEIRGIADVDGHGSVEHFDAMFDNEYSNWPVPLPGEVLLRGSIDLADVVCIYVRDEGHEGRLRALVAEARIRYSGPKLRLEQAAWIFGGGRTE